jgi:hypothetical protein
MMDGALQLPVDVEIGKRGKGYLDPDYQRVSMDFGEAKSPMYVWKVKADDVSWIGLFLDAFILGKIPSSTPASALPTGYLAQSDVMDNPTLIADVPNLPQYEAGSQKSLYRRTIWVGPKRSFTPFHKDPYVGIYSQSRYQFPSTVGSRAELPCHLQSSATNASTSCLLRRSTYWSPRRNPSIRTHQRSQSPCLLSSPRALLPPLTKSTLEKPCSPMTFPQEC